MTPAIDYSDMNVSPAHWDDDAGTLTHWYCCIDLPCNCQYACFDPINHPTDLEGNPIKVMEFEEDYYGHEFQDKVRIMEIENQYTTLAPFVKAEEDRIQKLDISELDKHIMLKDKFVVARKKYKAQIARLEKRRVFVERSQRKHSEVWRSVFGDPQKIRLKPKKQWIEFDESEIEILEDDVRF
jgi:hypothetical protein